jgi:hypothetical protein
MLDCKPFMMRGVSYSPVPWSHDPSYHEPFGDYFTDEATTPALSMAVLTMSSKLYYGCA